MVHRTHSPASLSSEGGLRPERALLHPLWWFSLALLAVNDHLLKGSGLLPDVLTGKLSDFAGLIVAPILLAALLRVRSRGGLAICYLAIAAVFSAIQVWPGAATVWADALGVIGIAWFTWSDPTDLIALVSLVVAWGVLGPVMVRPLGAAPWRTTGRLIAAGVGLVFCIATPDEATDPQIPGDVRCRDSRGDTVPCGQELCVNVWNEAVSCSNMNCTDPEWSSTGFCAETPTSSNSDPCNDAGGTWDGQACMGGCSSGTRNSGGECVWVYQAEMYVYNDMLDATVLRVQELRTDVVFDCEAVADNPASLLHEPLFEASGSWTMTPNEVRPIGTNRGLRECHAVILSHDAMGDRLVFWFDEGTYPVYNEQSVGNLSTMGVVLEGGSPLVDLRALRSTITISAVEPMPRVSEQAPVCGIPADHRRLEWTLPPAVDTPLMIDAVEAGNDGCLGVDLSPTEGGMSWRWYVCLNREAFPFDAGDSVIFDGTVPDELTVHLDLDPDLDRADDRTVLHLLRGADGVLERLGDFGLTARTVEIPFCSQVVDATCGTISGNMQISITETVDISDDTNDETGFVLGAGDSAAFDLSDGREIAVQLSRATRRPVVATRCSEGVDQHGIDAEIIITERGQIDE